MLAAEARSWGSVAATVTVRRFRLAVGFAVAAVAVGALLYLAEKLLFAAETRFVENPASLMMRACGLAHFWIGWLFLLTSPRLRSRAALLQLLGWTGVGCLLCAACAACGASQNPFVFLFFYSYFLIHEIRDETTLYQRSGDGPVSDGANRAFLNALSTCVVVTASCLLIGAYLLHQALVKSSSLLRDLPVLYYVMLATCLGCLCWHTTARTLRVARASHGSLRQALAAHAPLATVYAGIFTVLLLGLVAGSLSFNLIILIHAGAWLVYVAHQLKHQPPPARRNAWTWLRYSPAGFVTLHLAVIAVLLVLMALRVHCWQRVGPISELLAGSSFPYWSLMHISIAFWRPR